MVYISVYHQEIPCKVVYWGPGMSGRTTNLWFIRQTLAPAVKETAFDVVPPWLGKIRGYKSRFSLSLGRGTAPDGGRSAVRGVDGVVFVADSQPERLAVNVEALESLESALAWHTLQIERIPLMFQYNKRDLPETVPVEELEAVLNPGKRPSLVAVATAGVGVLETFEAITRQVFAESAKQLLTELRKGT